MNEHLAVESLHYVSVSCIMYQLHFVYRWQMYIKFNTDLQKEGS